MELPIGIQSFLDIRTNHFVYVDKTSFIEELFERGKGFYFLSRPRRFGKSLFLSTLAEAFQGKKELFEGLYLENHWDWSQTYPVLHLSWGSGDLSTAGSAEAHFRFWAQEVARREKLTLTAETSYQMMSQLITGLFERDQRPVVLLIDEYDKPLLDNLRNPEALEEGRKLLKNVYGVLKDLGPLLKFLFITGVSKFAKVSLFSGLNNLEDISFDDRFGTICGYTQNELETSFVRWLPGIELSKLKHWYNGYRFAASDSVYNPFDVLLFFSKKRYYPYWFESATPSFLLQLLAEQGNTSFDLEQYHIGFELFSSFDAERISLPILLYQTGYLTIHDEQEIEGLSYFRLGYPNFEVKTSLNGYILRSWTAANESLLPSGATLLTLLAASKFSEIQKLLTALFASIPHEWYRNNPMNRFEGYYASIVYSFFAAAGLDVRPEQSGHRGQLDMLLNHRNFILVFEFKVVKPSEKTDDALQQIEDKGYHLPYISLKKPIFAMAVAFEPENRNIVGFSWKALGSVDILPKSR